MTGGHPEAGWASDDLVPADGRSWDLLVLGGGTAGIVGARTAAGYGASVLLVERARTGGDCLWTGCVPSKALLAVAHATADARSASRYGVHADGVRVDFTGVMAHVRQAIATVEPTDSPAALRRAGVRVAHGTARLVDTDTADVDGHPVRFRQALLATGSAPAMPPIPGLAEAGALTSDTIWTLTELPGRLLVLGGGSIGCELGQAFARLGATVTLVEAAPRLLVAEDSDVAALMADTLADDGVTVRTGVTVTGIRRAGSAASTGSAFSAVLTDASEVVFDRVLVAVGRTSRTDGLGLERAGVEVDQHGQVRVDARLRTTCPRVWAAGDVTGYPRFTHTAGVHASLAASNAILGLRRTATTGTIPRVTFTQPEVASIGVSAERARAHRGLIVRTVRHTDVDRAVAEGTPVGFTRLVFDRRGHVVGATIVGPRAGESLAEVGLAVRHGMRARDLAGTTHAYPTYADGVWKAAIEQVRVRLSQPGARKAVRVLRRLRRGRLSG